jgi:TonB family protein
MRSTRPFQLMFAICVLVGVVQAQGSPDLYISSLQMPCYPPLARQAKIEGQVTMKIQINKDGSVGSAEAVEGIALLRVASLDNVKTWKFGAGPGETVTRETRVVFEYRLEGDRGFDRCSTRVTFDSYNEVEIIARPPIVVSSDFAEKQSSGGKHK